MLVVFRVEVIGKGIMFRVNGKIISVGNELGYMIIVGVFFF